MEDLVNDATDGTDAHVSYALLLRKNLLETIFIIFDESHAVHL